MNRLATVLGLLLLGLSSLGCNPAVNVVEPADASHPPDADVPACAFRCGESCCAAGEVCREGRCQQPCAPQCSGKQCGDDGCGGSCGTCGANAACGADFRCALQPRTGNDDCPQAFALELDASGTARERGTTTGVTGNTSGSCGGSNTNDVVYTLTLTEPRKVDVHVKPEAGSALRPVVYLRSTCDATASQIACGQADASTREAAVSVPMLGAGTWFLWVDGSAAAGGGASGAFELTVTASPPEQPRAENDACVDATAIAFDGAGKATVSGDTRFALNDDSGGCGTTTGGDLVYAITVTSPATLNATVTRDETADTLRPALYLRTGCAGGQELACRTGYTSASLSVPSLAPGTYYLFIDGTNATSGPFRLDLGLGSVPVNDTCLAAEPLTFDASGTAVVGGDTSFAGADSSGSGLNCGGYSGRDVVYGFTLASDKTVTATVVPAPGSALAPVVYLRSSCADSQAPTAACKSDLNANPVTATANRLPAGTHFLWVDGSSASGYGTFTLTVQLSDPPIPANETCASAQPLTLDANGEATVYGNTAFGLDDYQGSCGTTYAPTSGGDIVYSLALPSAASLTATLTRTGPGNTLQPAIYLRSDCAAAAAEPACARATSTSATSVTAVAPGLTPGTWFIVVDGVSGSGGEFKLDVKASAAVTNDGCASPAPITFDASGVGLAHGDTSRATNNDSGTCTGSGGSSSDLVYAFTLAQDRAVAIQVTPTGGSTLKPAIYVRTACEVKTSQVLDGCVTSTTAAPTQLAFSVLEAGTYFVWVDGAGNSMTPSSGAFTLTVTASAPPVAPAGDTCATAQALTFAATADPAITTATAVGETQNARNDASGVGYCADTVAGDLAYTFTLSEARKVTLKATPDATSPTFAPYVYLRASCAGSTDADMLACGAPDRLTRQAQTLVNTLPAGTYFVWVDGKNNGKFQLEVTLAPAVLGPANENCSAATPLTFSAGVATASGTTLGAQNDTQTTTGAGGTGGDVAYTFSTLQPQKVTVKVTPDSSAFNFRPVVTLRSKCASVADQVASATATTAGQPVSVTMPSLPAGAWFVWVDTQGTTGTTGGAFTLTVTLETGNDTCSTPVPLSVAATVAGNTSVAGDQYGAGPFSAACAATMTLVDTDGPDLVYSYTPTASQPFTVTVTPEPAFDVTVWMTSGATCGGAGGACIAAADAAGAGGVESLTFNGVAGTTYFIVVDSFQPTMSGGFLISVH